MTIRSRPGRRSLAVLVALTLAGGAACERAESPIEPVVIGADGGTVQGPNGTALIVPAGALDAERPVAFSLGVVDRDEDPGLDLDGACSKAYLVSPAGIRFIKPATLVLPDAECDLGAVLLAPPGARYWTALPSVAENGFRNAEIPQGGIVTIGPVTVEPMRDTVLYVGASVAPTVRDWAGRTINHAWVWTQSLNLDMIAPDNTFGGGKQRLLSDGVAGLRISVPAADFQESIEIRVLPNPAVSIRIIRGGGQAIQAGAVADDSLVAEVRAAADAAVEGAWVDFYLGDASDPTMLGSVATGPEGRAAIALRLPEVGDGQHAITARVSGTAVMTRTHAIVHGSTP